MKTTKILSVISLVLILSAAIYASPTAIGKQTGNVPESPKIHYVVNINIQNDVQPCNLYLIKILDGEGKPVAEPRAYVAGVSKYDLYESGPKAGVRIAVLSMYTYGDHYICDKEFFTAPAALTGKFNNGQTYRFVLSPKLQQPKQ